MNSSTKYLYLALFPLLFGSCEKMVPTSRLSFDGSKIVVNSELKAGQFLSAEISLSTDIFRSAGEPPILQGAKVRVFENGIPSDLTFSTDSQKYYSTFITQPGFLYELYVENPGNVSVFARARVPALPQAYTSSMTPNGGVDRSGIKSDLLKISFLDPANEKNYYQVNFFYFNTATQRFIPFGYDTNDPSLTGSEALKLDDGSFLFSDVLFNGKSKELTAVPDYGLVISNPGFKYLTLFKSISEDLWKYQTTLKKAKEGRQGIFGNTSIDNARSVFSNINNGLGIFAGSFEKRDTIW